MSDENPYRYEGTLESSNKPPIFEPLRISVVISICWKGLVAGTLAGVLLGVIVDPEIVGAVLIMCLFLLLPVGVFGYSLYRKPKLVAAQIGFWIAATPLALLIFSMRFDTGSDAGGVHLIGEAALIGYASQVIPASLALHYFAIKELRVAIAPEDSS